jgi:hypothetical protein
VQPAKARIKFGHLAIHSYGEAALAQSRPRDYAPRR